MADVDPGDFDLRDLAAPEPLTQALVLAEALAPGASVRVLTPRVPTILLELLDQRGLHHQVEALPGGAARVSIMRPGRDGTSCD